MSASRSIPRLWRQQPLRTVPPTSTLTRTPLRQRRHRVQYSRHLARRHRRIRQGANLGALAQSLESNSDLPALRLVDQEDVFLAVAVAHGSAEEVQAFADLLASLRVMLV